MKTKIIFGVVIGCLLLLDIVLAGIYFSNRTDENNNIEEENNQTVQTTQTEIQEPEVEPSLDEPQIGIAGALGNDGGDIPINIDNDQDLVEFVSQNFPGQFDTFGASSQEELSDEQEADLFEDIRLFYYQDDVEPDVCTEPKIRSLCFEYATYEMDLDWLDGQVFQRRLGKEYIGFEGRTMYHCGDGFVDDEIVSVGSASQINDDRLYVFDRSIHAPTTNTVAKIWGISQTRDIQTVEDIVLLALDDEFDYNTYAEYKPSDKFTLQELKNCNE